VKVRSGIEASRRWRRASTCLKRLRLRASGAATVGVPTGRIRSLIISVNTPVAAGSLVGAHGLGVVLRDVYALFVLGSEVATSGEILPGTPALAGWFELIGMLDEPHQRHEKDSHRHGAGSEQKLRHGPRRRAASHGSRASRPTARHDSCLSPASRRERAGLSTAPEELS
jgi:hypothetical protein